jgi:hypothetical protein
VLHQYRASLSALFMITCPSNEIVQVTSQDQRIQPVRHDSSRRAEVPSSTHPVTPEMTRPTALNMDQQQESMFCRWCAASCTTICVIACDDDHVLSRPSSQLNFQIEERERDSGRCLRSIVLDSWIDYGSHLEIRLKSRTPGLTPTTTRR